MLLYPSESLLIGVFGPIGNLLYGPTAPQAAIEVQFAVLGARATQLPIPVIQSCLPLAREIPRTSQVALSSSSDM